MRCLFFFLSLARGLSLFLSLARLLSLPLSVSGSVYRSIKVIQANAQMRKKAFLFSAFDWIDLAIRRNRAPGKMPHSMVLRFLLDGGFASPFGLTFLGGGGCVALSVRGGERTRKRYARTVWKAMQKIP